MTTNVTTQHTSGPWNTARVGQGEKEWMGIFDDFQRDSSGNAVSVNYIAKVFLDSDEGEANARLIAAAPDLLAALEALWYRGRFDAELAASGAWQRTARAAIAKARGS